MTYPDLLDKTKNHILYEQSPKEIHDMLIESGLTEHQAWLTYKGAKMLAKSELLWMPMFKLELDEEL